MTEKLRICDEHLELLRNFLLRPHLYVTTPESAETYFWALLSSLDIIVDNDIKLVSAYRDFKKPDNKPSCLSPSSYMTMEELIVYFKKFYDEHICIKMDFSQQALPTDKPADEPLLLSADKPTAKPKLNWKVYEYIGPEVYRWGADNMPWPFRIRHQEGLKPGDKLCFDWEDKAWSYEVLQNDYGKLYGQSRSGDTHACLEFNTDSRKCWVTTCFVNMKAIKKLHLHKETDDKT